MAEKKRTSFVLLFEHIHTMEELTDEEFGHFIRCYADFAENGVEPDFSDRSMRMMWRTVKSFEQMNGQKYERISEARRKAGKKAAEKRWGSDSESIDEDSKNNNCYPEDNKECVCQNDDSKHAESESDSESDSVAVANTTAMPPAAAAPRSDPELAQLVQHFQQEVGNFPRSALDDLQRWREVFPTDVLMAAMDEAAKSGHRSWKYIDGILRGWQNDGVRTLGDVNARRDAHEAKKKPTQRENDRWEVVEN